jgi:hypothetical protein
MAGRRRRSRREPLHFTAAIAPALLLFYCCFTATLPTSTAPLGMAGRRRRGQGGPACPAPQNLRKGHGSGSRAPRRRPVRACGGIGRVRVPSVVAYWPPPPSLCPPRLPPRQGGGGQLAQRYLLQLSRTYSSTSSAELRASIRPHALPLINSLRLIYSSAHELINALNKTCNTVALSLSLTHNPPVGLS